MRSLGLVLTALSFLEPFSSTYADVAQSPNPAVVTHMLIGGRDLCRLGPPPTTTESAAVLAPIIAFAGGKLMEAGSDLLGEYLNDLVKKESTSVTVSVQSTYFYYFRKSPQNRWTVSPALDCVVIARGKSGPLDVPALMASASKMDPRGRFRKVEGQMVDFPVIRELGLSEYPELYVELELERDVFESAFRARPLVVYFRQSNLKVAPSSRIELNIVLGISAPDGRPLGIMPVHMAALQVGVDYSVDSMTYDNPWVAMPPRPSSRLLIDSSAAHLLSRINAMPINATISIEESGMPGRFAVFMSRILANSKSDVGKATEDQIRRILHEGQKTTETDQKAK